MPNGWGGSRPNSGRKPRDFSAPPQRRISAKPSRLKRGNGIPAQPAGFDHNAMMEAIRAIERMSPQNQQRTIENCPFKIPDFPKHCIPKSGGMAMDQAITDSFAWCTSEWLAGGPFTSNIAEGLLFPGYAYLSELAQRPEYRILSEIIAKEATRKWISFHSVSEDKPTNKERDAQEKADEDEQDSQGGNQGGPDNQERGARNDQGADLGFDLLPSEENQRNADRNAAREQGPQAPPDPILFGNRRTTTREITEGGEGKPPPDEDKTKKIKELEDFLTFLNVRNAVTDLCLLDGLYGRGHLYLDCGDVPDAELLSPIGHGRDQITDGKIGRGWLKRCKPIEPIWTYPQAYNATNPLAPGWYDPQQWFVMGREIHATRLLKFVSRAVPDLLKPAYAFGGLSMSQLAKPYVDIWLKIRESVGTLVQSFSTMVLSTDLSTMTAPSSGGAQLLQRVALFNMLRSNSSTFVINKATEEFTNVNVPLSGLHELQAQAQEHMAFVGRYPLVKFTGIQPSGLNADSEGVIRIWYDTVTAYQEQFLRSLLQTVIDIAMITLWGKRDDDITFKFVPLQEMTEKERGEMQKQEAERDQVYIDTGVLSPQEVRDKVVNDPDLGYMGLDPEDVPELRTEEEEGLIPKGAGKGLEAELEQGGKGEGGEEGGGGGAQPPKKPPEGGGGGGEEEPGGEDASVVPFAEEHRPPDWHRVSKTRARYQEHPALNGDKCSLCVKFSAPNKCDTVAGIIFPEGYCEKYFEEKGGPVLAGDKSMWGEPPPLPPPETHKTITIRRDAKGNFIAADVRERTIAMDRAEWDEGQHPRAPDGKFGSGSSTGGGKQKLVAPQFGMVGGRLAASHGEKSSTSSMPDIPAFLKRSPPAGAKPRSGNVPHAPQYGLFHGQLTASHEPPRVRPVHKSEGAPKDGQATIVLAEGDKPPVSELNGVKFEHYAPPEDWADVPGQKHDSDEPEFEVPEGKRAASGVVIREPDGRIWLMQPRNGFGGYDATFPKGGVDEGLSLQANAIKEAYEETGLKVKITGWHGDVPGDTSMTRYYNAEREGGDPSDFGDETEGVVLAPQGKLKEFLNRTRDRKIANISTDGFDPTVELTGDEWHEADHPRAPDGKFGTKGSSAAAKGGSAAKKPELDPAELKQVGGQEGSNPGGVYENKEGKKFYIKKPQSKEHVTNELTAANLYKLAGSPVLNYEKVKGGQHVATEWAEKDKSNAKDLSFEEKKEAQKEFAVHAWLANWDVVGMGGDNIGTIEGVPTSLDLGGALNFRAKGGAKGAAFGPTVGELSSMRDASVNPDAAAMFGDMTDDEVREAGDKVASISDVDIIKAVKAAGGSEDLAELLMERKKDIASKLGIPTFEDMAAMKGEEEPGTPESEEKLAKLGAKYWDAAAKGLHDKADAIMNTMEDLGWKYGDPIPGKPAEEPVPEAPKPVAAAKKGSKKAILAEMLTKGASYAELTKALGWPSISVPAKAKLLGMKVEKFVDTDGVTKWKGTPMSPEDQKVTAAAEKEKAAIVKEVVEAVSEKAQKEGAKLKSPAEIAAAQEAWGKKYKEGIAAGLTPQKAAEAAAVPTAAEAPETGGGWPADIPHTLENYKDLYNQAQKVNPKAAAELKKWNPQFAAQHEADLEAELSGLAAHKAAAEPGKKFKAAEPEPAPAAPKEYPAATAEEKKKASKGTTTNPQLLGLNAPSTGIAGKAAHEAIAEFNDKYAGKTLTDEAELNEKVAKFKELKHKVAEANVVHEAQVKGEQVKTAAEAKAAYAKKEAAAKAEHAKIKADLGITDSEAKGFEAMVSMMGASSIDSAVKQFKSMEAQAKAKGYSELNGFENTMIKLYTGPHSGAINEALRAGSLTDGQFVYMKHLNKAIDKLPKFTGLTKRGINFTAEDKAHWKPGSVVQHENFASTSPTRPWSKNTLIHIQAIGKRAADVRKLSGTGENEAEVLYKSHTFFKVEKAGPEADGKHHIYVTEMDSHD